MRSRSPPRVKRISANFTHFVSNSPSGCAKPKKDVLNHRSYNTLVSYIVTPTAVELYVRTPTLCSSFPRRQTVKLCSLVSRKQLVAIQNVKKSCCFWEQQHICFTRAKCIGAGVCLSWPEYLNFCLLWWNLLGKSRISIENRPRRLLLFIFLNKMKTQNTHAPCRLDRRCSQAMTSYWVGKVP